MTAKPRVTCRRVFRRVCGALITISIVLLVIGLALPALPGPQMFLEQQSGDRYWKMRFSAGWAAIAHDEGDSVVYGVRGAHGVTRFHRLSKEDLHNSLPEAVRLQVGELVDRLRATVPRGRVTGQRDICDLLRAFTGVDMGDDPQAWRDWWRGKARSFEPPADVDARFVAVWVAREQREEGASLFAYRIAMSDVWYGEMLQERNWAIVKVVIGCVMGFGVVVWRVRRRSHHSPSNELRRRCNCGRRSSCGEPSLGE